jgi:thiamine biosynthesis lipoprotein
LATSGDYERGPHIIDPRTGRPASKVQGVTVIGRNAAVTDALSTALFVLGPQAGIELIETLPEAEALLVDKKGRIFRSSGFNLRKK